MSSCTVLHGKVRCVRQTSSRGRAAGLAARGALAHRARATRDARERHGGGLLGAAAVAHYLLLHHLQPCGLRRAALKRHSGSGTLGHVRSDALPDTIARAAPSNEWQCRGHDPLGEH